MSISVRHYCSSPTGILRCIEGSCGYIVRGTQIFTGLLESGEFSRSTSVPFGIIWLLLLRSKFLSRLTRTGIAHLLRLGSSRLIAISRNGFWGRDSSGAWLSYGKVVGSRPLTVAVDKNNSIYYGEYRNNSEHSPVSVWYSADKGRNWVPAWTFNNIRHIHGVFFDPYTNSKWVTTGDDDAASCIWITNDDFKTLERIMGGSQQTRAITLLFTKTHVYFGSDTPLETNHIYRLARQSGRVERLRQVESSVFWGCKVGDTLFFSTAVEPSAINTSRHACIWGSPNGDEWKCIAKFRKDIWPMKLFQYGQILFPAGDNQTGKLWFTPFATEYDQTVQCIDVQKIDWD